MSDVGALDDETLFPEADGQWVWIPVDDAPETEVPVGMVDHRISTMCRWDHRHGVDWPPSPQPCCYSVLTTITRLPGPVRTQRRWLALTAEEAS